LLPLRRTLIFLSDVDGQSMIVAWSVTNFGPAESAFPTFHSSDRSNAGSEGAMGRGLLTACPTVELALAINNDAATIAGARQDMNFSSAKSAADTFFELYLPARYRCLFAAGRS
jgi:hypothetical protein